MRLLIGMALAAMTLVSIPLLAVGAWVFTFDEMIEGLMLERLCDRYRRETGREPGQLCVLGTWRDRPVWEDQHAQ